MIYRVYAESCCHAEAICLIDGAYYDSGLSQLLERYFKKHRMIVTEGMEEGFTMDVVFKQIQDEDHRLMAAAPELLATRQHLVSAETVDCRDYEHSEAVIRMATRKGAIGDK